MDPRHPLGEPLPVYLVVARVSDLGDLAGLRQLMDPCLDHVEVDPRELLAVEGVGQLTLQPASDVHEPQQALGVLGDLDLGLVVGVQALPIQLRGQRPGPKEPPQDLWVYVLDEIGSGSQRQ